MHLIIIQHESSSPAGATLQWLEQSQIPYTILRLDQGDKLPAKAAEVQNLLILGGEMNVDQEMQYPWLVEEKKFIKQCIDQKKTKILGICLGGQLISEVMGAKVYKNSFWEIGWSQVQILDGHGLPAQGQSLWVPQWHGYVFDLPVGAELVVRGQHWANQGFRYGPQVLGFQFHPEASESFVRECAEAQAQSQRTSETEQSEQEILEKLVHLSDLKNWYFKLLDFHFLDRKS